MLLLSLLSLHLAAEKTKHKNKDAALNIMDNSGLHTDTENITKNRFHYSEITQWIIQVNGIFRHTNECCQSCGGRGVYCEASDKWQTWRQHPWWSFPSLTFQLCRPVSVQLLQVQELSRGEMQLPQQQQQQQLPSWGHIRGVLWWIKEQDSFFWFKQGMF